MLCGAREVADLGWAVLLTQPNRWRTAQEHAAQQGFDTWFPRTSETELLFPRYGFVRIVAQSLAVKMDGSGPVTPLSPGVVVPL